MPGFEPNDDDGGPVAVFETNDPSEQMIAGSILEEAGIPFEVQHHQVLDVLGFGQLGGSTLALGPVHILVPAAYAEVARQLLEKGLDVDYQEPGIELPSELAEPPIPEDPAVKEKRRQRAKMLASHVLGDFLLAVAEIYDQVRALIFRPSSDEPKGSSAEKNPTRDVLGARVEALASLGDLSWFVQTDRMTLRFTFEGWTVVEAIPAEAKKLELPDHAQGRSIQKLYSRAEMAGAILELDGGSAIVFRSNGYIVTGEAYLDCEVLASSASLLESLLL